MTSKTETEIEQVTISLRVLPDDRDLIDRAAERNNLTMMHYLRITMLKQARRDLGLAPPNLDRYTSSGRDRKGRKGVKTDLRNWSAPAAKRRKRRTTQA